MIPSKLVAVVVMLAIGPGSLGLELLASAMAGAAQSPPRQIPGVSDPAVPQSTPAATAVDPPGSASPQKTSPTPRPADAAAGASAAPTDNGATPPPATPVVQGSASSKLNELRAETLKKIEAVDSTLSGASAPGTEKGGASGVPGEAKAAEAQRALKDVLKARLDLINEYEKTERNYRQAVGANPEQDQAKVKADLEKLKALLDRVAHTPSELLPQAFRIPANEVSDSVRNEMKDAIDSTQNELKEWSSKLEATKGGLAKTTEDRAVMRAERDKIFQRVAALKARSGDKSPAGTKNSKPATPESQRLEEEKRINLEWETEVESLRLKLQEARISLEVKQTSVAELQAQVEEAHVQIAKKTLNSLQNRFREISDRQERVLKRAAATEQNRAAESDDPLERYRARRNAELFEMEAQTVKFEQTLAANPTPSPEEQKTLADQAKVDFEEVKQLLKDGEVSRLDAMRLNNAFRRIGPERDRVERNELSVIEKRIQYYGNALAEAELELIEDDHQDQFEHDSLLERLPPERRNAADLVFEEVERKHRALLIRRRDALKQLSNRASEALKEVMARLDVLDDEYGFIRTSIFWVRDQDPISFSSINQVARELARLGKGFLRLTAEAIDQRNWNEASAEFVTATTGLLLLPLGIMRIRRKLHRRLALDLPELCPTEDLIESSSVPALAPAPEPE